jgi:hypothetical protein
MPKRGMKNRADCCRIVFTAPRSSTNSGKIDGNHTPVRGRVAAAATFNDVRGAGEVQRALQPLLIHRNAGVVVAQTRS